VIVLSRKSRSRVWLRNIDRLIFVWLYRLFPSILNAITVVLSQNLNPDILMMQPAKDWNRCDASGLLRAPKVRSIFIQRKMGPNFVVI
jgi:hypothetical protein